MFGGRIKGQCNTIMGVEVNINQELVSDSGNRK